MDWRTMTFENWLTIMASIAGLFAVIAGLLSRSIKNTIKADISGPLATLDANYKNLCDNVHAVHTDATARADMHERRLDEMQRDTRIISERVMSLESWRQFHVSGAK